MEKMIFFQSNIIFRVSAGAHNGFIVLIYSEEEILLKTALHRIKILKF